MYVNPGHPSLTNAPGGPTTFVKDEKPAYIAYVGGVSVARGGEHLKVGHRCEVTINLGARTSRAP